MPGTTLRMMFVCFAASMLFARQPLPVSFSVVVNVANPVEEMTPSQLRDVLFGNVREWPSHRRITVVQREPGSPVATAVFRSLLRMSAEEYNRYLLNLQFRGLQPVAMKTLISDKSACDFVFNAPGAIGFISSEALDQHVCQSPIRIIRVTEKPEDARSR